MRRGEEEKGGVVSQGGGEGVGEGGGDGVVQGEVDRAREGVVVLPPLPVVA